MTHENLNIQVEQEDVPLEIHVESDEPADYVPLEMWVEESPLGLIQPPRKKGRLGRIIEEVTDTVDQLGYDFRYWKRDKIRDIRNRIGL